MTTTPKFQYKCNDCGATYDPLDVQYMCPACNAKNTADKPPKGVLKTIYDYESIKKHNFQKLKNRHYIDILPIKSTDSLPNLAIGHTPLYTIDQLDGERLEGTVFLKDDAQNPTFSYKDRASAIVSAYAKEQEINTIVTASTGNAGSSLAGICAAQGQQGIIMVPASAPVAKLTQILMYGATLIPVDGTYDDAFDLSIKATEELGWYNRNTGFNPLTIEGKKTVAFELYEQMGYQAPDRIFVPVGDGVIISGVYKGFEDLLKLGLIEKMPTIVAVQSTGSDNIARNLSNSEFVVKQSNTIADSISVDIPRNYHMAKNFITSYNGEAIAIEDNEILEASYKLSKNTGVFTEPASAAAFGGLLHYKKHNKLKKGSKNVVLLTGSGLKDLKAVQKMIQIPSPIMPNIDNLKKIYHD
ncbi:MAG TPA: threonine synthase [Salinivirga sp.]|uniref:threonine synthase n=1 Tax=Salinivirga sp. TaxID=1970192 RepID=UPI002B4860EA|nr:threonine synthase [Salinivirga sp.]HKK59818.1 threonine synthase [Salinivirga sp.]